MTTAVRAHTARERAAGFTLIELIAGVVLMFFLSALLMQIGGWGLQNAEAPQEVVIQYEAIQELEDIVADYRAELENDTLNLSTFLAGLSPQNGVTATVDTISVSQDGGGYTFGVNVYKVTVSKDGQTYSAYFTQ